MKEKRRETDRSRTRGRVLKKKGCKSLYILFYYFGQRLEMSTGEPDTPENWRKWETWLDRNMEKVEKGTFEFSKAFPNARPEKKAMFDRLEKKEARTIDPRNITIGDFAEWYLRNVVPKFRSQDKRIDYSSIIRNRVIPSFRDIPFGGFSRIDIANFISALAGEKHEGEN